jgi:hypothetical protein
VNKPSFFTSKASRPKTAISCAVAVTMACNAWAYGSTSPYPCRTMWIVKGVFIGFGFFLAGLVLTAIVSISFAFGRGQVQAQHAASLGVVYGWTLGNPLSEHADCLSLVF